MAGLAGWAGLVAGLAGWAWLGGWAGLAGWSGLVGWAGYGSMGLVPWLVWVYGKDIGFDTYRFWGPGFPDGSAVLWLCHAMAMP